MYVFYATVILIGVVCVAASVFLYILDRKRVEKELNDVDKKLDEITDAINDAEQIVVEMNNFSDYLLEKIDSKVKVLENKLESCEKSNKNLNDNKIILNEKQIARQDDNLDIKEKQPSKLDIKLGEVIFDLEDSYNQKREKNTISNDKHKKVHSLKDEGLEDVDIAKELDIGIREVRLILGIKN